MNTRIAVGVLGLSLLVSGSASAQDKKEKDKTRWGVSVGFGPSWVVDKRDKLETLFFDDGDEGNDVHITGSEFRIGVARGRELGGDWAVSFLKRNIDNGSTLGTVETECGDSFTPPNTHTQVCAVKGFQNVYRDAGMIGLEVNKFIAFGTIKKRVQIGLNIGIGIAKFTGEADQTEYKGVVFQQSGKVIPAPNSPEHRVVQAADLFITSKVATGKFAFSVAGILPGSIKVRADIGYAFPGVIMFGITGNYLFGHR